MSSPEGQRRTGAGLQKTAPITVDRRLHDLIGQNYPESPLSPTITKTTCRVAPQAAMTQPAMPYSPLDRLSLQTITIDEYYTPETPTPCEPAFRRFSPYSFSCIP